MSVSSVNVKYTEELYTIGKFEKNRKIHFIFGINCSLELPVFVVQEVSKNAGHSINSERLSWASSTINSKHLTHHKILHNRPAE